MPTGNWQLDNFMTLKQDCNGVILTSFKTMTKLSLISASENRSVNNFSFNKMYFSSAMQKEIKNSKKSEYTDIWAGLHMLYILTEMSRIIYYIRLTLSNNSCTAESPYVHLFL